MTERQILISLRERRIELGWTLREAATFSQLLPSTIWRIETGKSNAYLNTVLIYAHALGMDLDLRKPRRKKLEVI